MMVCIVFTYTRAGAGFRRKNGVGGNGGNVWLEALPMYQNLNHIHYHHNRKLVSDSCLLSVYILSFDRCLATNLPKHTVIVSFISDGHY